MICRFEVGQKVVCIDSTPNPIYKGPQDLPNEGQVYTISWIGPCVWKYNKGIGVHLKEHTRDMPLGTHRFRPATDITTFQNIVAKVMNRKKVRA